MVMEVRISILLPTVFMAVLAVLTTMHVLHRGPEVWNVRPLFMVLQDE